METLFWICVVYLAYVYFGYPAITWLCAAMANGVDSAGDARSEEFWPDVTVVTAAHNEAEHIRATIENKLNSDYPPDRLDVIVVSDESVDDTDEIVASFGPRVTLVRQEPRAGKTAALNTAVSMSKAEIIVFSDANSLYQGNAIRRLVSRFEDPAVGYVTGKMVYVGVDGSVSGDGCTAYMRYENFIRAQESALGAVIGVDGGIDAVRRSIYSPMRADQQPDFVLPLCVLETGSKVVYESSALLKEQALEDTSSEYQMRVRVSLRALWALWDKRQLLNPFRHRQVAWQLLSHKVLRYLAFLPLVLLLVSNSIIAGDGVFYSTTFFLQILFYSVAALSIYSPGAVGGFLGALAGYFVLINVAAAHAFARMLSGERMATWKPRVG